MTAPEYTATIDDLLRHVEESDTPAPRRRTGVGWAVRAALLAGALTALTVFGLRLLGLDLSAVGVFAGFLAVLLIRRVTARLAPPVPARQARRRPVRRADRSDQSADDALRSAVRGWQQRLTWADGSSDRFARVVLPRLRDLADERLRQRHGVTRASDPDRARELLGEPAWSLLADSSDRSPTLTEYAAVASGLEKI
jgi:hypothetical protein